MDMTSVREALERAGVPGRDLAELPSSTKRFPDGAHWRVEVSGIETTAVLRACIDEAKKQRVPFHRAISVVRGATWATRDELAEFARVAHDERIEVILTPGPRPTWYSGRQIATPEGAICGMRLRGCDMVAHYVYDVMRAVDIGFRGFLVWDEGVLMVLNEMKKNGDLPKDVTFKVSIFAGHANAAGAKLLQSLGAGTFNPIADSSLAALAAMRKVVDIPMDVHIQIFDTWGGINRFYETPEIARVAAPCYFKMESGTSVGMYAPWGASEAALSDLARLKIKSVRTITEIIKDTYPDIKVSDHGVPGLAIPQP